jgi:hypothetical protein
MKLYMFRTVPLSIIRSYSLYTQQWYMSNRQLSSSSWIRMELQFHSDPDPTVNNSWWWTEELSETCKVSQNKIWEISASIWFYYKEICHDSRSRGRKILYPWFCTLFEHTFQFALLDHDSFIFRHTKPKFILLKSSCVGAWKAGLWSACLIIIAYCLICLKKVIPSTTIIPIIWLPTAHTKPRFLFLSLLQSSPFLSFRYFYSCCILHTVARSCSNFSSKTLGIPDSFWSSVDGYKFPFTYGK